MWRWMSAMRQWRKRKQLSFTKEKQCVFLNALESSGDLEALSPRSLLQMSNSSPGRGLSSSGHPRPPCSLLLLWLWSWVLVTIDHWAHTAVSLKPELRKAKLPSASVFLSQVRFTTWCYVPGHCRTLTWDPLSNSTVNHPVEGTRPKLPRALTWTQVSWLSALPTTLPSQLNKQPRNSQCRWKPWTPANLSELTKLF